MYFLYSKIFIYFLFYLPYQNYTIVFVLVFIGIGTKVSRCFTITNAIYPFAIYRFKGKYVFPNNLP